MSELPLRKISAGENTTDCQKMFWLGRDYLYYGENDLCIGTLKKYLLLSSSKLYEERSAAMRLIAIAFESKGVLTKVKSWLFKAIAECPTIREPYLEMARLGYNQSNWPLTYTMVNNGLSVTTHSESYLAETECWGYALYDLGAISAYHLGLLVESKAYAAQALAMDPENKRLQSNLRLIEAKITEQTMPEVKVDEEI